MIGALHIGEGPSLFSAEQANEVTSGPGYAKPRAVDTVLDGRDVSTRSRVLDMVASGMSLEDIAKAGGKYVAPAPTFERAVRVDPDNLRNPSTLVSLAGLLVGGVLVGVAVRQAGGNNTAQGLGTAAGCMVGLFAARMLGGS